MSIFLTDINQNKEQIITKLRISLRNNDKNKIIENLLEFRKSENFDISILVHFFL